MKSFDHERWLENLISSEDLELSLEEENSLWKAIIENCLHDEIKIPSEYVQLMYLRAYKNNLFKLVIQRIRKIRKGLNVSSKSRILYFRQNERFKILRFRKPREAIEAIIKSDEQVVEYRSQRVGITFTPKPKAKHLLRERYFNQVVTKDTTFILEFWASAEEFFQYLYAGRSEIVDKIREIRKSSISELKIMEEIENISCLKKEIKLKMIELNHNIIDHLLDDDFEVRTKALLKLKENNEISSAQSSF
jgi:hypothetical protein